MAALTAAQRTTIAAAFDTWMAANWEAGSYTSTGNDLLTFADKMRRYAAAGVATGAKYDLQLGAFVALLSVTQVNKDRVRTHCTGG